MALKINDKVLSGIAASNSPIDREGWLNKKENNKTFTKRWFVLKGNLLFYYDKKTDREPVGVIILVGYRVELDEDDERFTFKIIFHGMQERPYVLGADSQHSMELWMKAIACAAFDYMKLMVADLQRQIDEIEESASRQSGGAPRAPPRDQRYNPFNTVQDCASSKQDVRNDPASGQQKITFGMLHAKYGEKILHDREERRLRHIQEKSEDNVQPLIEL